MTVIKSDKEDASGNVKRVFDTASGIYQVKIFSGDWYVSRQDEVLVTILGSCVAACVRDPIAGVGGMNHFLLPGDNPHLPQDMAQAGTSARYGMFAMESLINGVLKAGGHRDRLEFKVFGGGNLTHHSARIGSKNAAFIRSFLRNEGFPILSEDLEGDAARRLHYHPVTGKVLLRRLPSRAVPLVLEDEKRYRQVIKNSSIEGEIDLF